jgi:hypothetical protein
MRYVHNVVRRVTIAMVVEEGSNLLLHTAA